MNQCSTPSSEGFKELVNLIFSVEGDSLQEDLYNFFETLVDEGVCYTMDYQEIYDLIREYRPPTNVSAFSSRNYRLSPLVWNVLKSKYSSFRFTRYI